VRTASSIRSTTLRTLSGDNSDSSRPRSNDSLRALTKRVTIWWAVFGSAYLGFVFVVSIFDLPWDE
jgi:hypothetical protein